MGCWKCMCYSKAISDVRKVKPVCHTSRSPHFQVIEMFLRSCETTAVCVRASLWGNRRNLQETAAFQTRLEGLLFRVFLQTAAVPVCARALFIYFCFFLYLSGRVGRLPHTRRREGSWTEGESCWRRRRALPPASETRAGEWGSTTGPLRRGRETERTRRASGQTANGRKPVW